MFEKNALRKKEERAKLAYSSSTLKIIGCVLMLIGTFGVAILQNGVMDLGSYSTESLLEAMKSDSSVMTMATIVIFCSGIASFALPIYSLIIVEGYKHTSNLKKYLIRIAITAFVAEIPYDLAMRGKWFDLTSQNPVFGVLIALLMLYFLDYYGEAGKIKGFLIKLFIVVAAVLWTVLIHSNLGAFIVLITAVLWLLDGNGIVTTMIGIVVSIFQFPAPFGFLFNHFYDGRKGMENRKAFYVFYPVQLLVLGLIGKFLLQ